MAICKYPGCTKQLVGKEKLLCKSCADKSRERLKKAGEGLGVVSFLLALLRAITHHPEGRPKQ